MVNAVSFGKHDNENNPTGGKWIGTALGAALGGYAVYDTNKAKKEIQEFLATAAGKKVDECKDFDSFRKFLNESTLSKRTKNIENTNLNVAQWGAKYNKAKSPIEIAKDFINQFKNSKKLGAGGVIFNLAFFGAIGLGLGAIVDHFRKKDEDD